MRGGKRPGAGRRKGAKGKGPAERAALKAYFEQQAIAHFAAILEQYFRRAEGKKSTADPRILVDVLNRTLGKPLEQVQLSGEGEPLAVRIVHREVRA